MWESSFPFLNQVRMMLRGEKPWDSQVKLTVCPGVALVAGPDTSGGEGLAVKERDNQVMEPTSDHAQ